MKKIIIILFSAFSLSGFAQSGSSLSLSEAEKLFLKNNLSLLAARFNVDAAHAAVVQAKLWENPNFQVGVNAYNPDRKKYFDIGPNGEKSFSVEQLIHLGGKKHDETALARSNQQVAEYEFSDLLRNLKLQLRQSYFDTYYDNLSYQALTRQMSSVDSLINSYDQQVEKGNLPEKDLVRLQGLYLNFKQERSELYKSILENQNYLAILTGVQELIPLPTAQELSVYEKQELPTLQSLTSMAIDNRSDYLSITKQVEAAKWNLKWQKAQNVPDLSVGVSWDQQAAAFNKSTSLSLGIPLPLWNRNQGNIRAAAAQVKIADANKNLQQQKIENEVILAYKKWKDAVDNHKLLNQVKINKFREVEKGVLMNFRHGNLSLIEFTDFMENYNQTLLQYHRFAKDLVTSCEEINYITNSIQF